MNTIARRKSNNTAQDGEQHKVMLKRQNHEEKT